MRRILGLCLLFACCQAQAITLKIATLAPDGTSWMEEMRRGADAISQRTEGRVELKFYPGGVMGNDKSVLRKIRAGQLQGGTVTVGGLAAVYPDGQIYSLPFSFRNYDEVDYVRGKMDDTIAADPKPCGFEILGIGEGGFAYLMSNKPVRTIEDLKQQKVWIPEGDTISQAAFESLGISPIPLPVIDVLTGLQTGLIDTVSVSPIGAIALQWHTRVKYLLDVPLAYTYGGLVIQCKVFEKLEAADQATVREILGETFRIIGARNRQDNTAALETLRNQGIQFVTPAPEDVEKWRDAVSSAMEKLGQKGVFSQEILDRFTQYLHELRQHPNKEKE